jgi:hypothetical protein
MNLWIVWICSAGIWPSVWSSVGAWTSRKMIWHQRPLSIMYDILSLTNSTLLTADTILLCTKNLYLFHDSHSLFHRKMCILPQVRCHRPPIWPALPLELTYVASSPETVIREPTLYKLLTFLVPNLISIFRSLGRWLHSQYIRSYSPWLEAVLSPATRRFAMLWDRNPHNMASLYTIHLPSLPRNTCRYCSTVIQQGLAARTRC